MKARECGFLCMGMFLGGALGAGVALLTAPHTGAVTRRKIRRAGEDIRDELVEAGEEWTDRGIEAIERGRDYFTGKTVEAKRKLVGVAG